MGEGVIGYNLLIGGSLDKTVTVKFFGVYSDDAATKNFKEQIEHFLAITPVSARERNIGSGILVRLETAEISDDFIEGDFCRIQKENIPPEVGDDGLAPLVLPNGRGLGHLSAFLYHRKTQVLLLQDNRNGASRESIVQYLSEKKPENLLTLNPIMSDDAFERLFDGNPKKFTFGFAQLDNVDVVERDYRTPYDNAVAIAQAFSGPKIEVTVSMGRRDSVLDRLNIANFVRRLTARGKLKKALVDQGMGAPPINLLTEQLQNKLIIDLPTDSVKNNYLIRISFVRDTFEQNMEFITNAFGKSRSVSEKDG